MFDGLPREEFSPFWSSIRMALAILMLRWACSVASKRHPDCGIFRYSCLALVIEIKRRSDARG